MPEVSTTVVEESQRTAAERFWYVLGCIAFAGAYFAKIPVKSALRDAGRTKLTSWESSWYYL